MTAVSEFQLFDPTQRGSGDASLASEMLVLDSLAGRLAYNLLRYKLSITGLFGNLHLLLQRLSTESATLHAIKCADDKKLRFRFPAFDRDRNTDDVFLYLRWFEDDLYSMSKLLLKNDFLKYFDGLQCINFGPRSMIPHGTAARRSTSALLHDVVATAQLPPQQLLRSAIHEGNVDTLSKILGMYCNFSFCLQFIVAPSQFHHAIPSGSLDIPTRSAALLSSPIRHVISPVFRPFSTSFDGHCFAGNRCFWNPLISTQPTPPSLLLHC